MEEEIILLLKIGIKRKSLVYLSIVNGVKSTLNTLKRKFSFER